MGDNQTLALMDHVAGGSGAPAVAKAGQNQEKTDAEKLAEKEKKAADAALRATNLTPLEKADLKMKDTLTKGKESRSLHTQLDGMGLSTEIATDLGSHAKFMEDQYKKMRDLIVGTTDKPVTEKTFDAPKFNKLAEDWASTFDCTPPA